MGFWSSLAARQLPGKQGEELDPRQQQQLPRMMKEFSSQLHRCKSQLPCIFTAQRGTGPFCSRLQTVNIQPYFQGKYH